MQTDQLALPAEVAALICKAAAAAGCIMSSEAAISILRALIAAPPHVRLELVGRLLPIDQEAER